MRKAGLALVLAAALGTAGCGFTPLYDRSGGSVPGIDTTQSFKAASVAVTPIADRVGQMVRQQTQMRLSPRGRPARPAYLLDIRLDETVRQAAIGIDTNASRETYTLSAGYRLRPADGGPAILAERVREEYGYNVVRSTSRAYSEISARDDARRRASIAIGEDISRRIAIFFATGGDADAPSEPGDPAVVREQQLFGPPR